LDARRLGVHRHDASGARPRRPAAERRGVGRGLHPREAARRLRPRPPRRAVEARARGTARRRGGGGAAPRAAGGEGRRGAPETLRAPRMTGLLVGLACFALYAAVTLAWLRVRRGPSPVARHALSALGTHAAGVVGAAFLVGPFAYWPAAAV